MNFQKTSKEKQKVNTKYQNFSAEVTGDDEKAGTKTKKQKKAVKAKGQKKTIRYRVSLRLQVLIGFLVPILLIVLLGARVYSTAEEGLIDNYKQGAMQTLGVTSQLLDSEMQHIEQLAFDLYLNEDIYYYSSGVYDETSYESVQMVSNIRDELIMKMADPIISDIYIIPTDGVKTMSSTSLEGDAGANVNIYSEVEDDFTEDNFFIDERFMWSGEHTKIDDYWGRTNENYIISCYVDVKNSLGLIIVDVSYEHVQEAMEGIEIPEGASLSYVTHDGREINRGTDRIQGMDTESFYLDALAADAISGNQMVEVDGETYLFMYHKCEKAGSIIAELVPEAVIMEKAEDIRDYVILIAIFAVIIVGFIGTFIATGLQRKIARLQDSLRRIAKGDFTATVEGEGTTAFGQVNKDMTETISGVKHLIRKVKDVAGEVSNRVEHVEIATGDISKSANDINAAIDEIAEGTTQQANDATDCLTKMDELSQRIISTSTKVEEVTGIADQTIERINVGSKRMEQLVEQSVETGRLSEDVGQKVVALAESSKQIESFVSQIEEIADETNLLSLNASIEAARAGEAGRGFAVVADEIQKLSENSMVASRKIADVVTVILGMTEEARVSTEKAVIGIEEQQVSVKETGANFAHMNKAVLVLLEKLKEVTEEISLMQNERQETLNGIENISSVSEETAAVSENVGRNATNQKELTDKLKDITNELKVSTDELMKEISLFTIE